MGMNNNIFIRANDRKYINTKDKVMDFFYNVFNRIRIEKIQNGLLVVLPKKYHSSNAKLISIKKQILKIIKQEKTNKIIYAKNVISKVKLEEIKSVYNHKILMKLLLFETLDYVYNAMSLIQALEDIYIFVNDYNNENLYIINRLVKNFKSVNIITKNLLRFKGLEKDYEKKNFLITVSNNKRKSAQKAHVIINLDFNLNDFELYYLNKNSIIINLKDEKLTKIKNFNGIIINDINIILNKDTNIFVKEFYGDIELQSFLESYILNMNFEEAREFIRKENVKIFNVTGVRGIISKTEIANNKSNMYMTHKMRNYRS